MLPARIRICPLTIICQMQGINPLGQISLCEIHKLVPELVRLYEIRLADPEEGFRSMNHWFNKPLPMSVRIRKRDNTV